MTPRQALALALEVLLGFVALAVFAWLAFGHGPATDEGLLRAFRWSAPLAVAETAVLMARAQPLNRLILGANLWLISGGLAAWTQQWWWLRGCQHLGEAGLFLAMAGVGLASTLGARAGFVGVVGEPAAVRRASWWLLGAVLAAAGVAVVFRGEVTLAAVLPVMALSWGLRGLRRWVRAQ